MQPLYASSKCSLKNLNKGIPIALLIANSQYKKTLRQPVNDAKAMKKVLTELGFRVIFKTELNKRAMNKATLELSKCLQITQGVGLFYFTGYGMPLNENNYLLPINANIRDKTDLEFDAFPVRKLLRRLMMSKNELNIIILDASRKNPYPNFGSRGLANQSPPIGFFIAYPAEETVIEERWAKNSLYIRELIKILKKAKQNHARIEDVLMQVSNAVEQVSHGQQVPWHNGSAKQLFCFGGCKKTISRKNKNRQKRTKPPQKKEGNKATVTLIVLSNVEGATLFINGKNYGDIRRKRKDVKLLVGRKYTVRVEKNGYEPFHTSFYLQRASKLNAKLKKKKLKKKASKQCSCCGWYGCTPCPCQ